MTRPVQITPPPRERAAYWMLLSLAQKAALMVKLLPRNVDRGCPKHIMWLTRICNADMLRTPELLCVESSKNAREAALCHLTVNRNWPSTVGAKP